MIKLSILLVFVAAAVGFVLVKGLLFNLKRKRKVKANELLIANGNNIEVPLNECDIKTSELLHGEAASLPTRIEMVDALFGKERLQPTPSTACYIIYTWRDNSGNSHRFLSSPIFTSPESLRLRLDKQRNTKLYIDPGNVKNYFFDIRFLNDMIL